MTFSKSSQIKNRTFVHQIRLDQSLKGFIKHFKQLHYIFFLNLLNIFILIINFTTGKNYFEMASLFIVLNIQTLKYHHDLLKYFFCLLTVYDMRVSSPLPA